MTAMNDSTALIKNEIERYKLKLNSIKAFYGFLLC